MKDRSDDPSHHERTPLPRSYISLHHEGSIRQPIAPWTNALPHSYISLHHEGSIWWPIAPWANAITTELHLTPPWRIDPTTHRAMNKCSSTQLHLTPPWRIDLMTHRTMSEHSYHGATSRSLAKVNASLNSSPHSTTKDRSDNPSHHDRTLLPQSYMSLLGQG